MSFSTHFDLSITWPLTDDCKIESGVLWLFIVVHVDKTATAY